MFVVDGCGAWLHCPDGGVRGITFEQVTCPCGKTCYFVVNRDGRTRCDECDRAYQLSTAKRLRQ